MTRFTRRQVLHGALGLSVLTLSGCGTFCPPRSSRPSSALAGLEARRGGRLGVCVLDAGSGREWHWRGDERFGMCSTFKLPLAASVLLAIRAGELDADEMIGFTSDDLVPHAPVVQARLDAGITAMTPVELAQATQLTSDNVAANLLIRRLGGPEVITARWRVFGDATTRLDRWEPEMNLVPPGELRDTTTPCAMARHVGHLMHGDTFHADDRATLRQWLIDTQTGLRRLRAGLPEHWPAGDKTGTGIAPGMANKINDVAVAWPPDRAPVVIAAYYEAPGHDRATWRDEEAILAEVGRIVADGLH